MPAHFRALLLAAEDLVLGRFLEVSCVGYDITPPGLQTPYEQTLWESKAN